MSTVTVYVGDKRRELIVTAKEAKRHSLRPEQSIDVALCARITRDRVIDAGLVVDKVLARSAQRIERRIDKGTGGHQRYIRQA